MGKTESALAETRRPRLALDLRQLTLLAGTFFFALSFTAKAQDQATLVGSVTDASGAAIPGSVVEGLLVRRNSPGHFAKHRKAVASTRPARRPTGAPGCSALCLGGAQKRVSAWISEAEGS